MSDIDLSKLTTEEGLEVAPGVRVRLRSLVDYRQNEENPVSHTPRHLPDRYATIAGANAYRRAIATLFGGTVEASVISVRRVPARTVRRKLRI